MNIINITGNLGRDAEVKQVGGSTVMNFSVGVKTGFGDSENTCWVSCALWGKQAESKLADYMVKGQRVSVSGEFSMREYDSQGITKQSLECRVNQIGLEGKSYGAPQQQRQPAASPIQKTHSPQQQAPSMDNFDDDIPF